MKESRLFAHFGNMRELKEFAFLRKIGAVRRVVEESDRFVIYHKPLVGSALKMMEEFMQNPEWTLPLTAKDLSTITNKLLEENEDLRGEVAQHYA